MVLIPFIFCDVFNERLIVDNLSQLSSRCTLVHTSVREISFSVQTTFKVHKTYFGVHEFFKLCLKIKQNFYLVQFFFNDEIEHKKINNVKYILLGNIS